MLLFSILTAAVAPGISLLTYFYLKDRYEAEPIHMVIRVFLLGVLIVLPIMVIQTGPPPLVERSSFSPRICDFCGCGGVS